ncbi:MAG: ComF family protein [Campylobacterota bacterium]|nr:ComF family protein [Campylobacterota bacterium]
MRCISCHRLSWKSICSTCSTTILKPSISKRMVGSLEVYSFYHYQNISKYIASKYTMHGYLIYRALANITTKPFMQEFSQSLSKPLYIIGIDEKIRYGYSHVAILTHVMQTPLSIPLHHKLVAQNQVNYAGKSLDYRLNNPRDFKYSGKGDIEAILVDDTITTGITLQEAYITLQQYNVKILFALTLSDAKER